MVLHKVKAQLFCGILLNCLVSSPLYSQTSEDLGQLAQSKSWLRLGVWRELSRGGFESEQAGAHFFLSPHGKTDPEAELKATIHHLSHPSILTDGQSSACVYPARKLFLERHGFWFPTASCSTWESFLRQRRPRSITLVYASAYANNPVSMAGHLFLKLDSVLHRSPDSGFLDQSVGFLAQADPTDNPVIYTLRGLWGGYSGRYQLEPYSQTYEIYVNGDRRDLWEFRLALTEEQGELLLAYLWELYSVSAFDYYFLGENCAYRVLALLDIAFPETDLVGGLSFPVLPISGVRVVRDALGPFESVSFKPSLDRVTKHAIERLSDREHLELDALLDKNESELPPVSAPVLDAAISVLNQRKYLTKNQLSPVDRQKFRAILVQRSKMPYTPVVPQTDLSERPDLAHLPRRLGLGLKGSSDAGFLRLSFKPGLHDFLAKETGYDPLASINYLDTALLLKLNGSDSAARISLEKLVIAEVISLMDFTFRRPDLSWRMSFLLEQPEAMGKLVGRAEGGIGIATQRLAPGLVLYSLLGASVGTGQYSWGAGVGSSLAGGVLWRGGLSNLLAEGRLQAWFVGLRSWEARISRVATLALSVPSRETEFRLSASWHQYEFEVKKQVSLDGYRYF